LVTFNLNSVTFGTPVADTKMEKHDELRAQEWAQFNAFGLMNFYASAKNSASEVGYFGVKPHTVRLDNFMMPISNQYFNKYATGYYADMFPAINFGKSIAAQK